MGHLLIIDIVQDGSQTPNDSIAAESRSYKYDYWR